VFVDSIIELWRPAARRHMLSAFVPLSIDVSFESIYLDSDVETVAAAVAAAYELQLYLKTGSQTHPGVLRAR
jgi:hypothetical protein